MLSITSLTPGVGQTERLDGGGSGWDFAGDDVVLGSG